MQKEHNTEELREYTLEEVFEQLESVISGMEEETSLEASFKLYHKGMDMLKVCNDKIDKVEKQMLVMDEGGETHES